MRSRTLVHDPNAAHFVTSTTVAWLPVFTTAARCDILIESRATFREHKNLRGFAAPSRRVKRSLCMGRLVSVTFSATIAS